MSPFTRISKLPVAGSVVAAPVVAERSHPASRTAHPRSKPAREPSLP
jgi:hypothetical protein